MFTLKPSLTVNVRNVVKLSGVFRKPRGHIKEIINAIERNHEVILFCRVGRHSGLTCIQINTQEFKCVNLLTEGHQIVD